MPSENIDGEYYEDLLRDYNRYKRFNHPSERYQILSKLRFVNIFFDTPTFDRITKDKSAKVIH